MPDARYFHATDLVQLALLLLIPLELLFASAMRAKAEYDVRDTLANVAMSIGSIFFWGMYSGIFMTAVYLAYRHRLTDIPFAWWSFALAFVLEDLRYYVWHRISHRSRWFWASHVVHHSSQRYNLSTALRQTWTGSFTSFIFWLWLPIVGFAPVMIMTMKAVSLLYQFWIHTELVRSMGSLEKVMNTPSHHRVHHGSNPRYIDRNHGGTLIIWDKLFGTFEPENPADPPRFGLTHNITTFNPVRIAFHEWVQMFRDAWTAPGWSNKFRYVFGNPGWRHDDPADASLNHG